MTIAVLLDFLYMKMPINVAVFGYCWCNWDNAPTWELLSPLNLLHRRLKQKNYARI